MIANYLAAEPLVIAQIKAQVAGLAGRVFGSPELAQMLKTQTQTLPAAFVLYDGEQIETGAQSVAGLGARQMVRQRWLVVLAVRNVTEIAQGTAARQAAGPLLSAVIQALSGWAPSADFRPLRRATAPRPGYEAGLAFFPLLFTTQLISGD